MQIAPRNPKRDAAPPQQPQPAPHRSRFAAGPVRIGLKTQHCAQHQASAPKVFQGRLIRDQQELQPLLPTRAYRPVTRARNHGQVSPTRSHRPRREKGLRILTVSNKERVEEHENVKFGKERGSKRPSHAFPVPLAQG